MIGRASIRTAIGVAVLSLLSAIRAAAQTTPGNVVERAFQTLAADAAKSIQNAIALRVQQTISSLPPSNPQPLLYEFDREIDAWTRSERVPPAAFLTPDTMPRGSVALRISVAYFELRELDKRANYLMTEIVDPLGTRRRQDLGVFKFGVTADARAEIVSFAASYGLTQDIEIDLDVPISIVTANASIRYSATPAGDPILGPLLLAGSPFADFTLFPSTRRLDEKLAAGSAFLASRSLADVGLSGLDGSTEVGLSRVSIASKISLLQRAWTKLAFQTGLFLPSPNEDELAGSATTSIYPRFLVAANPASDVNLYTDLGYDYDFDDATLRRFAWSVGGSYSGEVLSLDIGVKGSLYQEGIQLFSSNAELSSLLFGIAAPLEFTSLDQFELATNFVDLVFGVTVPLGAGASVSGTATVPVVNVDFRPEAIGVISAQFIF